MTRNHKSSPNADFLSNPKCENHVKFSLEKPVPRKVKELYNDTNDTVNQVTLKRSRGIKHDKKKKIKRKKTRRQKKNSGNMMKFYVTT